ncbi:MAG: DUF6558 family protein [Paenibacillus dendritiformis]|uniref:phage tail domain-containing protein n=1 Tax=uncultured Paenibacillus sp. TaxID=227322 RepID=UPI0025E866BF|nr:phage tail domain-containing protein [uncultured Paenibacillus sp.]MDU5143610.1 DUF6558 family protein [Paenibacillus dendritiformis]
MANWLALSNLLGVYTSEPLSIALAGDGALTKLTWECEIPPACRVTVQTSLSPDQGRTWSDWKTCVNGGGIPDIEAGTPLREAMLRYRLILQSGRHGVTPAFQSISFRLEPVVVFDNKGDVNCSPEIWITKEGSGEFAIVNTSRGDAAFRFEQLLDEETVYVNNDRQHIETSLVNTYRYSEFNDGYLSLPPGRNVLKVRGNAAFQFRYQFRRIQ